MRMYSTSAFVLATLYVAEKLIRYSLNRSMLFIRWYTSHSQCSA